MQEKQTKNDQTRFETDVADKSYKILSIKSTTVTGVIETKGVKAGSGTYCVAKQKNKVTVPKLTANGEVYGLLYMGVFMRSNINLGITGRNARLLTKTKGF